MQSRFAVPALVLLFGAIPFSSAQVEVAEPLIRFASTEAHLHEMCGPGRFDACTLFVGFALTIECMDEGPAVRMRAAARVTPWILVLDMKKARHETEHIRDVAQELRRYGIDLERLTFPSNADCRAAALTAQSGFGKTIRGFARASSAHMNEPLR